MLGRGAQGKVLLAVGEDKRLLAVKRMSKKLTNTNHTGTLLPQLEYEVRCLEKCQSCPFVVRYEKSFKDTKYYYIVTEFVAGGSLEALCIRAHKSKSGGLKPNQLQFVAGQLVLALCDIHERGVIYR